MGFALEETPLAVCTEVQVAECGSRELGGGHAGR